MDAREKSTHYRAGQIAALATGPAWETLWDRLISTEIELRQANAMINSMSEDVKKAWDESSDLRASRDALAYELKQRDKRITQLESTVIQLANDRDAELAKEMADDTTEGPTDAVLGRDGGSGSTG